MTLVRIALANIPYPDSPADSVTRARAAIADAGRANAAIVCFPECYVPGYRRADRVSPPIDAAFLAQAWSEIALAAAEAGVYVVLGTERVVDGAPRISVLAIDAAGARVGFQDKVQLDPSEDAFYSPGTDRELFRAGPLTFGVSICHEGFRYPETVRWSARRGAQLVFHPHYSWAEGDSHRPTTFGEASNTFHESAVLCRAAENTCYVASINYASEGSPTTSVIARPDGSVLAWQPYGVEGLLVADIDTDAATGLYAARYRPKSS